jgi:PTH1 family peptidyl-tRNA hydrolase
VYLVVGLGNPEPRYARNRHNIGFAVVDELADRCDATSFKRKFSGELARAQLRDDDALLFKPMTFMNLSGDAVQPCAAFFKVPLERVVVIHDELDLPFGTVRLKKGGGHGGHNGLRSLVQRFGGGDFVRVRFGIGRPPPSWRGEVADYVLNDFSSEEREKLEQLVPKAAKTVLDIAARGLAAAMKRTNTRPKPKPKAPKPKPQPPIGEGEPTNGSDRAQSKAPTPPEASENASEDTSKHTPNEPS